MSWISYTLLTFYDLTWQVKAITSVLYGCHFSFEFTLEFLINKFEIRDLQVHPWNSVKHIAIHLCINILIWSYKCCGIQFFFCKVIKKRVQPTPTYQNSPRIRAVVLGLPYEEIFPPDAEIFSLAEM